jgi:hypothetical protein
VDVGGFVGGGGITGARDVWTGAGAEVGAGGELTVADGVAVACAGVTVGVPAEDATAVTVGCRAPPSGGDDVITGLQEARTTPRPSTARLAATVLGARGMKTPQLPPLRTLEA